MTTTDVKIGLTSSARPSSRVLKPPGGGHSNIFAEPEVAVNAPRPKYNQQNSTNLNACIGSTDPNQAVEKLRGEISSVKETVSSAPPERPSSATANKTAAATEAPAANKGRVPPGGHSSGGFW